MPKTIRVIPRLDIKGPNLVKGIHLEGLRVLGKPEQFARIYYEEGADELIYMDVVASLYGRNSLHNIIEKTAKEIFIPLTVGGGIRTIDDIKAVLRAGADKVSLNTIAIKYPQIIKEASLKFGSSTILVSIEAIKQKNGEYLVYTDNGREYTGVEVRSWAQRVEELGAGEIMITSIDREGTGSGYDSFLIKMISEVVSIPVIACGGAGKLDDAVNAVVEGGADAVAMASILHYDIIRKEKVKVEMGKEGNIEFLKSGKNFVKVESCDISTIKNHLIENDIICRYKRIKGYNEG
jgi:imidazole glycerol-phosphate synthase subunit HisF